MRRGIADDQQVEIAGAVEIDRERSPRSGVAADPRVGCDVGEGAGAIVVPKMIGTVGDDHENVEIAIVVGVDDDRVDGVVIAARDARGLRGVAPAAVLGPEPQLIRTTPAEERVDASVVVDVRERCEPDVGDRGERMRCVVPVTVVGREEHRVAVGAATRDEDVESAVVVKVRDRDRAARSPRGGVGDRERRGSGPDLAFGSRRSCGRQCVRGRHRLGPQSAVDRLHRHRPRIRLQAFEGGERRVRGIVVTEPGGDRADPEPRAAQIRVEFGGPAIRGHRLGGLLSFKDESEVVPAVGIRGIAFDDGAEPRGGAFVFARSLQQDACDVRGAEIVGMRRRDRFDHVESVLFVVLQLPVHDRDGEIDLRLHAGVVRRHHTLERVDCVGVLVAGEQSGRPAVIGVERCGVDRDGRGAGILDRGIAGGKQQERRRKKGGVEETTVAVSERRFGGRRHGRSLRPPESPRGRTQRPKMSIPRGATVTSGSEIVPRTMYFARRSVTSAVRSPILPSVACMPSSGPAFIRRSRA